MITENVGSAGLSSFTTARDFGNLILELDAKDPNANGVVPTSNYSMSIWKDKSGLGNNVAQATGANQPTYNVNSGNPQIDFNGTSSYLSAAFGTTLNPSDVSVYVLCFASAAAGTNRTPLSSRLFNGSFFGYSLLANSADMWGLQVGVGTASPASTLGKSVVLGEQVLLRALLRTATNPLVVNGTGYSGTSASYSPNTSEQFYVGALENAVLFFNGSIKHVLVFNVCHTQFQSNQIANYLQTRWQGVS